MKKRTSPKSALLIAGVDEAGRGPLAGPVVAAAVILSADLAINGLADSKKLSAQQRTRLARLIKSHSLRWAVGEATVGEIDRLNILQATLLAMRRAVESLGVTPGYVRVDGIHVPAGLPCAAEAVVKGDVTVPCISAASIIAKTHRDALMLELDALYPQYGFKKHKGYGTREHIRALEKFGYTPMHRRSFSPVRKMLEIAFDPSAVPPVTAPS